MPLTKWNGDAIFKATKRAAMKASVKISGDIVREAKRRAPVGVSGIVKRAIAAGKPRLTEATVSVEVGFTPEAPYGRWVEMGRRPGKRPPIDALIPWVERVLGAGRIAGHGKNASGTKRGRGSRRMKGTAREREIRSIAFLVARKIGRKGTPAQKMITRSAEAIAPFLGMEVREQFLKETAGIK